MLSKIWTISVLIEPLLLFVFLEGTGIGSNISRLLQFIVILLIVVHFLMTMNFRIGLESQYLWKPYIKLIVYVLIVTFLSFLLGGYDVGLSTVKVEPLKVIFLSNFTRPFVEIIILLFQFFYFIILAPFFLRRKKDFDFFFKCCFFFLFCHFTLGWIDWFLNPTGFDLIPRHLSDGRDVGQRFHGIAGEPRDAAIYMMTLFFLITIYSLYKKGIIERPRWPIVLLILVSCLATNSASFVAAVGFGIVLVLLYFLPRLSIRILPSITIGFALVIGIIIYSTILDDRISNYFNEYKFHLLDLYKDPTRELPHLIKVSYNNVFPLIRVFRETVEWNIFPLLFGYGLGSSGVANSFIYGEFMNPNNQLVRFLYEYGLVGTGLFFGVFLQILSRCTFGISIGERNILFTAALIMLGGLFGHRTNVWMIWLGLLCAVTIYRRRFFLGSVKSPNISVGNSITHQPNQVVEIDQAH